MFKSVVNTLNIITAKKTGVTCQPHPRSILTAKYSFYSAWDSRNPSALTNQKLKGHTAITETFCHKPNCNKKDCNGLCGEVKDIVAVANFTTSRKKPKNRFLDNGEPLEVADRTFRGHKKPQYVVPFRRPHRLCHQHEGLVFNSAATKMVQDLRIKKKESYKIIFRNRYSPTVRYRIKPGVRHDIKPSPNKAAHIDSKTKGQEPVKNDNENIKNDD